ncbi:Demethylmenaquinone methyltransferase [Rosistilla carotiformis]|uniref:Demethylmenaquinone methyltransferase n=1 Tax=Rosistilla carotiformis TaxID=2528017 RepID=A0A518JRG9_9BACT|nr:class I SAM-dependent methyltransferase [Rosistilla carotiformis]QDV68144.1 Demethylmenaquinone methyltransferase [Rosistilla carotiformis]
MTFFRDLKTLLQLALPIRGNTHQQRLENFYGKQADNYDVFRRRLLHGREPLWQSIEIPEGGRWVDFGGGTGANVENIADKLNRLERLEIVDLSASLLQVADRRIADRGWRNVVTHCRDVTTFTPDAPVDIVTFSYSLTMIPDWFAAVENALRILKPGGTIGVVDFYVSRKYPAESHRRHGPLTRSFWPTWFAKDNVFLSPDHLPYLESKCESSELHEDRGGLPFVPLLTVPYYRFVGKKPLPVKTQFTEGGSSQTRQQNALKGAVCETNHCSAELCP